MSNSRASNRTVKVDLGANSYDITVGEAVTDRAVKRIAKLGGKLLVVSNRKVEKLYGGQFKKSLLKAGCDVDTVLIPDGERHKTMATVGKIHNRMVGKRLDRRAVVIALGGGVTGDIAGFAAATYMRGVRFVQAPTTLLAQVDSSVGGKTGVNHPKGKNLIGAFYQPSLVVADIETLNTLPKDEILCGVAEVIKYGCIADTRFFGWLEKNIERLVSLEPETTIKAVTASCRIKAAVVSEDEKEAGLRAILNFGHTVGHAIEAATGYKRYKHGFAVAIGMVAAANLSELKGSLRAEEVDRVKALISRAGLPTTIPTGISDASIIKAMAHDKKAIGQNIRFALLDRLGKCRLHSDISIGNIREALNRSR